MDSLLQAADVEISELRPSTTNETDIQATVLSIIHAVKEKGDTALKAYSKEFDGAIPEVFCLGAEAIEKISSSLSAEHKGVIDRAYTHIFAFHAAQQMDPILVETMPGLICEKQWRPIDRVGLYIPGGSAPLFSTVLMLGVPSQIAHNPKRILVTPYKQEGLHPAIAYAAQKCAIDEIYQVGGAQAIAAMAYGTTSIPKVDKIFGPGNAWVTSAKLHVSRDPDGAAIDMPAGPSEVLVIADGAANASYIASDLLSQLEHDPSSVAILISDETSLLTDVQTQLTAQLPQLDRQQILKQSIENLRLVHAASIDQAIDLSNRFAPEHLILHLDKAQRWKAKISNAGSVFLGAYTPEVLGDYASGTNHVLPTSGYAKTYSGVDLQSFYKSISFQQASQEALQSIGPDVMTMAHMEGLDAHRKAIALRIEGKDTL